MLQVSGVSLQYGSKKLFEDVNLKFTKGNCYGIIGANGAGKSTFLKVLSGEIEPQKGYVSLDKNERMSVLQQNQNMYDKETVLRTVMLGYKHLVDVMDEKDAQRLGDSGGTSLFLHERARRETEGPRTVGAGAFRKPRRPSSRRADQ